MSEGGGRRIEEDEDDDDDDDEVDEYGKRKDTCEFIYFSPSIDSCNTNTLSMKSVVFVTFLFPSSPKLFHS